MILDQYKIVKTLGKGGMGEVFLAKDLSCQRWVALKLIREKMRGLKSAQNRFLREATIAARLSHPAIIPILSIVYKGNSSYYTMPYVEGKTLKQLLKESRGNNSEKNHPHFIRIFLAICQAVAYSHSQGIIHRDLKPENIIIGKFGEVFILDWGLAQMRSEPDISTEIENIDIKSDLTIPGKIVGTLAYLAPERALDEPASEQSDIYALGVILYEILTLQLPFKRKNLTSFRKNFSLEQLIEPIEATPYREIPLLLNQITKKCLQPLKKARYQKSFELTKDLELFLSGKSAWIRVQTLQIDRKSDWELQENILFAQQIAVTHYTQVSEWANVMISKKGFMGNLKIEALLSLRSSSKGIGFLVDLAYENSNKNLNIGYCIWIGSHRFPGCKLFKNNIQLISHQETFLTAEQCYSIEIEKTEGKIKLLINKAVIIDYISHLPLTGTKVGLLTKDGEFSISQIGIFRGSENLQSSCLAVPDAFLIRKLFGIAVTEYRKIAISFPGSREEREALFRSGITLLEKGLSEKGKKRKEILHAAIEEFGKLKKTSGKPLEYIGKSLVYKVLEDWEEEAKCIEFAILRYRKHPLFFRLVEHALFRLHEASSCNKISTYYFALLILRQIPDSLNDPIHHSLINQIQKHWETSNLINPKSVAVHIAFLLGKPAALLNLMEQELYTEDGFYALLELECFKQIEQHPLIGNYPEIEKTVTALIENKGPVAITPSISNKLILYLFRHSMDKGEIDDHLFPYLNDDVLKISALLLSSRWELAENILLQYSLEERLQENSPLLPLFGSFLYATEGKEAALRHFHSVQECSNPQIYSLIPLLVTGRVKWRLKNYFIWEQIQLYRYFILFYHCSNQKEKKRKSIHKLLKLKKSIGNPP